MKGFDRPCLPLLPLLRAYVQAGVPGVEELGPRFAAVQAARGRLLTEAFLDQAAEADFLAAVIDFYRACVQPPLHEAALRRRGGIVRHALGHFLRCPDPLPDKMERCLAPDGPYHVAGLGPVFWSAVAQGLDPARHPAWVPAVEAGLRRLGLPHPQRADGPGPAYRTLLGAYSQIRSLEPSLSALHIDHFLELVGRMQGRDLFGRDRPAGGESPAQGSRLDPVIRQERARTSLRRRLRERGQALEEARRRLEAGLGAQDGLLLGEALTVADPAGAARAPVSWKLHAQALTLWVSRLWEADDPPEILEAFWRADPIPGAGLWLPPAVLHLKRPQAFFPWDEAARQAYALLDDAVDLGEAPAECYALFNEGVAWLCERHRLHPLEAPAVLAALAEGGPGRQTGTGGEPAFMRFGGFCPDTFHFLAELGRNNCRSWMEAQRDRYRFAVREPLIELCKALAQRYVEPVLRRRHGWDLETAARSGRALTSVCKNDYGRSVPYHTALWITFYRRTPGEREGPESPAASLPGNGKRDDAQLFVRLDAAGVSYGLRVSRTARAAGHLLRRNVQDHAEVLYRALCESGAVAECRFGSDEEPAAARTPAGPGDLRAWAAGKSLVIGKSVPADDPLVRSDELAGDILLTFDRLLPAYVCAVDAEPCPTLTGRAGLLPASDGFTDADFCRLTYLGRDWVGRARDLLALKRQLILQGVPGTGKTHVARCLARLLTCGRDDTVRLVQFHPAYSYEEFVEGIKVRSVEVNGRHDVTYPVEDGLLCAFAAEAARRPATPHVLIIDEINRGNLPRIFGELLYLLEYREQTIGLPYSKRAFQLPANLYLLGTMNAADRSVALVDQALRRRFSFLEMAPDSAVLAAWLRAHPPRAGEAFTGIVVGLFDRLNTHLKADLGPFYQIGHSYFMVPDLDRSRLEVVWAHHVRPLLEEYFAGQAARLAAYDLDRLLNGNSGTRKRKRAASV